MLKRKYIKRAYIEEAICDKCGSRMEHTGIVLNSYPAQYPYNCTNKDCDGHTTFWGDNRPGVLKYEFEEEEEKDLPPDLSERITQLFSTYINEIDSLKSFGDFIHTIDAAIGEDVQYV